MNVESDEDLLDLMDIPDHQETNADLAAYADHTTSPEPRMGPPGPEGPCHACGVPAKAFCLRCERPACTNHHHLMYGLCSRCAHRLPDDDDHDDAGPPDLDIPWVE